jgi:Flp pilus assembly protein TadG
MMIRRSTRRRGMTIVESALVLAVFSLLLFGLFEYCRFLYVLHVTHNAARDGARYAVVNLDKPTNFDSQDYTDSTGTTYRNIRKYTTDRLGGAQKQLVGYQLAVFAVDPVGLGQSTPVIRPKSTNPPTYPDPFDPNDTNHVPWNQTYFTESVGVTVRGEYRPLLPGFLFIPSSVPINITAIAGSEG